MPSVARGPWYMSCKWVVSFSDPFLGPCEHLLGGRKGISGGSGFGCETTKSWHSLV